jgi:hypothetical protein
MNKKEAIRTLDIPKDFKGVVDNRKTKDPTIQFYEWVMIQMKKPLDKEGLKKLHVSEVMMTPSTGKHLYELQKKAIKKKLKHLYTDKKIATEAAFFWLAYGPSEAMLDGEDFKVYLTKDWYQ